MDYIQLLPYLPLSFVFIIPVIFGLYQLLFTSLRSPIQFQQGLHDTTSWRSALCGALIAVSPFVCVLPLSSVSSIFLYPVGYVVALLFAALAISPTLHYIPSPSICQYLHLRFHLPILRASVVLIQMLLVSSLSVILLVYSTSFLATLSSLSPLILCPIIAYLGIFGILFGGQTTVSAPTLLIPFIVIVGGLGVLAYKGIDEWWYSLGNLDILQSVSSIPMWIAFSLGALNGLHLVIASPLLYQQFFSLSTRQRLRNAMVLHVLFFVLFAVSLLSASSSYSFFLSDDCPPSASFSTIISFLHSVLPSKPIMTNFLAVSCILVTTVSFSFTLLSLSCLIWEDVIRTRLSTCSQIKQLYCLRMVLVLVGSLVTMCAVVLIYYGDDFLAYAPFAFVSLSILAAPVTALFLCSFMLPCTNSQGAVGGLLIGYLTIGMLSLIHFRASVIVFLTSPCTNSTMPITMSPLLDLDNSTLISIVSSIPPVEYQPSHILRFLQTIPFAALPLVAFTMCCVSTCLVSLCFGGEDYVALDWNLIACASVSHLMFRHRTTVQRSRRAFIESESFRYAQQTPYPDTNYLTLNTKMDHFQERQKLT